MRAMKGFILTASLIAMAGAAFADYTLEDLSPHFATNAPIIWEAPTNHLPSGFWIYQKAPRVFSAETISNAVVLASFQAKGFPKASKHQTVLWADHSDAEPMPPCFTINPASGQISFSMQDRRPESAEAYDKGPATVNRAWGCLVQLQVDPSQFVKTNAAGSGVWGIFLPRQIDGWKVFDENQGFSFEQLTNGTISGFSLTLPNLIRKEKCPVAIPQQIIACIRAFKAPTLPQENEPDYFGRLRVLGQARKLTIKQITPCYSEGMFGESLTDTKAMQIVMPVARLEAIADFGNSNMMVNLYTPITSNEVARLLVQARISNRQKR